MYVMYRLAVALGFACSLSIGCVLAEEAVENHENIAGSTVFSIAENKPFKFFTFTLENDVFVGDDSGFTNGLGFTFGTGPFLEFSDENLPTYLNFLTKKLYIQTMPNKVRGVAHMFFQRMQTPEDIVTTELQIDDAPYAGQAVLQSTLFAWDTNRSDQLSLFLGFVGPIALAEPAQTRLHAIIGAQRPNGWDNQLENELVFRVEAIQTRKLYKNYRERRGFDVLALGSVSLGTLLSDAQIGMALRWGSNLEFSHATFNLDADRQVNSLALSARNDFFFYLGGRLGWVANDILIDGNTFDDSHSVPLKHAQGQVSGGLVLKQNKLAYVFQLTTKSSRSPISSKRDTFGAFSITYPFR